MTPTLIFLGSCMADGSLIDHAIHAGLKADAFQGDEKVVWLAMMEGRAQGRGTDFEDLYLALGKQAPVDTLSAASSAAPTSIRGRDALNTVMEQHALSRALPALIEAQHLIETGAKYPEVKEAVEAIPPTLAIQRDKDPTLKENVDDALAWVASQFSNEDPEEKTAITGLPHFDSLISPIQKHEYVVVGARTSIGKSSFMAQMAGANLRRGLKVAYFTLETSARAVLLQMAAQRAKVNIRNLRGGFPEEREKLEDILTAIRQKPFLVFEKDLTLEAIEARCRLLAASFKPDVVFIDYLGLIRAQGKSEYERMTKLSKSMIPLRKSLGCALVVAAQLNRGNEREERAPKRTDFRDAGSIEEDAHRILALHRPKNDENGIEQDLERTVFLTELYQLKLRDGPLAQSRCSFNSKFTLFTE